jgi:2-methylcitrate dehydratase
VRRDEDIDRDYPAKLRCRVDITMRDGTQRSAGVDYPHGHHLDPMTDAEIEAKFFDLASRKLDAGRVNAALRTLWEFDKAASADTAFAAFAIEASSPD